MSDRDMIPLCMSLCFGGTLVAPSVRVSTVVFLVASMRFVVLFSCLFAGTTYNYANYVVRLRAKISKQSVSVLIW